MENAYREHLGMLHFNRGRLPFEIESDLEGDAELWEMGDPAIINFNHASLQKATTLLQEHDILPSDAFPELKAIVTAGAVVTGTARQTLEEYLGRSAHRTRRTDRPDIVHGNVLRGSN